jgi:hypothetical protein
MPRLEKLPMWILPVCLAACSSSTVETADTVDSDPFFDNVAACETWIDAMSCKGADKFLDCKTYADTPCDVSDFFDCLTKNTTCDKDGNLDTSHWGKCMAMKDCE